MSTSRKLIAGADLAQARQARYAARDVLAGGDVVLSDGLTGRALGVSAQGALKVRTDAGVREITSAEVSVRPAPVNEGAA